MATLDDKILGEKQDYYCSSSSGEEEEEEKNEEHEEEERGIRGKNSGATEDPNISRQSINQPSRWDGVSKNTGPKGVLEDWNLFKKQQEIHRLDQELQLVALVERNSLTCASGNVTDAQGQKLDDLESDEVLQDFLKKRMETMNQLQAQRTAFSGVEEIADQNGYLKLIDGTDSKSTVIVHIYEPSISECVKMNECLLSLSSDYSLFKFCKIKGSIAGVSHLFKNKGVPALLVYKGGELIGNFIRLREEFGSDFYPGDVENFLIENGIFHSKS